ncbi:MAG: hypothetical protein JWN26_759 [Candidatus Saccharibacteria bacterium]|nr:hypothetical protein [Candidatus Saccharibacteria bacterium]
MKSKRGRRKASVFAATALAVVLGWLVSLVLVVSPASADDTTPPTDTPTSVVSTSDPTQSATPTDGSTTAPVIPAPDPTPPPVPAPVFAAAMATVSSDGNEDSSQITFCHADGKSGNYNKLTTSTAAFYQAGHIDHSGDIFPAGSIVKKGVTHSWDAQGDQSLLAYPDCVKPIVVIQTYDATLWQTDAYNVKYPQTKVSVTNETTITLPTIPTTCGTSWQGDVYIHGTAESTWLTGTTSLAGPDGAQDGSYLAPGGNGVAYIYVVNDPCPPPPPPAGITCTVNGPAYTESGDHTPTQIAAGVDYRSYHDGHATGTVIPVSGNAQGVVSLSFTDTNVVGNGMFSRLIFNLSADGGPSYASFSVSPGNTIDQNSVAGVGSNSHVLGLTIAQVATAYPHNTYTGYAFQTGSSYPGNGGPTSDGATLTGYAGDCGTVSYVAPEATFPDGSQTCNTYTLPTLESYEKYPLESDGITRYTAGTHPLVGTVTVVAHTLASDITHQQGSHTYTFTSYDCPLTPVTPVTPQATCNTDTNTPNPALTFSEIQADQPTGVHTTDNGDGTVSFSAEDGYVLTDGSATTYSLAALSDLVCATSGADSSSSVSVAAKCGVTGVATVTPINAHFTVDAPLDQSVGTHDVSLTADTGFKFDNGSDLGSLTRIVTYTIPAATICIAGLAFTGGTIAWGGLGIAGGALILGIALLLIRGRSRKTSIVD